MPRNPGSGRKPRFELTGLPASSDPGYARAYWRATRLIAIGLLGGVCARCGMDDERILQLDHVNDDGYLDRPKGRPAQAGKAVAAVLNGEREKYQLLCPNCHALKTLGHL